MSVESGKQSFKEVLDNLARIALIGLKEIAVKEISKTEAVRKEVETQKVAAGKNMLWQYFPYIIGAVVIVAVLRFK